MKITEFSLRNPLVVSGIAVALCLFGLFGYFTLGVAITPNVNFPAVAVALMPKELCRPSRATTSSGVRA